MDEQFFTKAMMWLQKKNPRYARAVYLRSQYDLTFDKIAEELGVSNSRARQLFIRGANLLRKHVEKEYAL